MSGDTAAWHLGPLGDQFGRADTARGAGIVHRDPALARAALHKLEMGYAKRAAEAKTGT